MMTTVMLYRMGVAAFERRDYRSAINRFTDVLAEAPGDVNVLEWRARAYYHSAALTKAEADVRSILAINPTEEYALLLLARILERQNRHDEAAGVRRRLAAMTGKDEFLEGHRAFAG